MLNISYVSVDKDRGADVDSPGTISKKNKVSATHLTRWYDHRFVQLLLLGWINL